MVFLVDLLPELTIRILFYLSPRDITAWQLAHPSLRALIDNSVLVQYHIVTQLAGVEDNLNVELSMQDRLERLRALVDGWARLDFDFSKTEVVPNWSLYKLTGVTGGIAVGDELVLNCCTLPRKVEENTKWRRIEMDRADRPIDYVGMAIYEHDLIAVTLEADQDYDLFGSGYKLEIFLFEFSMGKPHPEARQPILIAQDEWHGWSIDIQIVGDTLALMVPRYKNRVNFKDNFYLFNWKTGALNMHVIAPYRSCEKGLFFLFLSPTLILLPNCITNTLEFWDTTSTSPFPIGALGLPPLSDEYNNNKYNKWGALECWCEPNPVAKGTPHSKQPFHTMPATAIAIFNFRTAGISMFVHRGTLLGLCPPARDSDGEGEFEVIPWETWGPGVTRWLDAGARYSRCGQTMMQTAGARAVIYENAEAIILMDFHPARIHMAQEGEPDDIHMWVEAGETVVVSSMFAAPLVSRLPYVARRVRCDELPMYEEGPIEILIDEERLIMVKLASLDNEYLMREIVFNHVGATPVENEGVGVGVVAGVEVLSITETVKFNVIGLDRSANSLAFIRTDADGSFSEAGMDLAVRVRMRMFC